MSRIGLAILGCGFAARLHSRTLRRFRDVQRYYASRDAGRAADFSRRHGGVGHFGSYAEAIASSDVDVILIATPPASHLQLTLDALAAGKHVIVEKPPFPESAAFDEVEAAAEVAGRKVFVAENYYYKPILRRIRELVTSQAIGEVRIVSVNALKKQSTGDWRDSSELAAGGAFFEGGIHWVNFMANLGLRVRDAQGYRPGDHEGLDRSMIAVFDYEEGAVGTLKYSWEIGSPMKGLRLSAIYGSEGAITFETNGIFLAVRGRRLSLSIPEPTDLLGYSAMFEDFFGAIRTGRPPEFDLGRARLDLRLVERIYETANRPQSNYVKGITL